MLRAGARIAIKVAPVFVIIGFFAISLRYASPFARSWDEVDFALALDRFDLLAMQPHFPGYPYFILGASIIHRWIDDPVRALAVFNAIAALSSAIPIALIARKYVVGNSKSLFVTALVLTSPYLWLMAARPMSEGAGIALLWWFLWSIRHAMENVKSTKWHLLALILFGFLMGTRLSFFPFGIALIMLWVKQFQANSNGKKRRLAMSIGAAGLFQLVWVVGLALSEGTLAGFWKLSKAFAEGHFSQWGGGFISTPMPLGERFILLFGENLIRDVLLGRSVWIGVLLGLLSAIVLFGQWIRRQRKITFDNRQFHYTLLVCIFLYAVWALFGQNIEKPRHIAPIAGPLLFLLYLSATRVMSALRDEQEDSSMLFKAFSRGIPIILVAIMTTQLAVGVDLLKRQAEELPAVYQLHRYLSSFDTPFVVYTWEETRVLGYLQADYEHHRIVTYDYFKAIAGAQPDQRVFLTDHVLQGFEQQDSQVRTRVNPIAAFKSDALFDPVYTRIILYEWQGNP